VSVTALHKFVAEEWNQTRDPENPTDVALMKVFQYNRPRFEKTVGGLKDNIYGGNANVAKVARDTEQILKPYDLVYLPTYRRVEVTLKSNDQERHYTRRRRPLFDIAPGSFYSNNIRFGLTDISERLSDMNETIAFESNREYRKISAAILNDLIENSFEKVDAVDARLPSRDDLNLLFSRVGQSRRYGPYETASTPDLDKIYDESGEVNHLKNFFSTS